MRAKPGDLVVWTDHTQLHPTGYLAQLSEICSGILEGQCAIVFPDGRRSIQPASWIRLATEEERVSMIRKTQERLARWGDA